MIFVSIINYSWYFYALYILVKDSNNCINITRLKNAIFKCGPMGIKLMQFIIMYDNLLPKNLSDIFKFTLEDCNQHSWKDTEKLYYINFNKDITEDYIITDDDTIAIGSGSIGQVYKLYNRRLNKYIAIKVKHPNIDKDIYEFVTVINMVLRVLRIICNVPYYSVIQHYKENIVIQNNFIKEAKNTIQLRENFKNEYNIIVPEIYDYSKDFIIMSYHNGISVDKITNNQLKYAISNDINFIILTSIMIYDFTHADLHNGNWKIEVIDDKYNIIIYDCGLVASSNNIELNRQLMISIMIADYRGYINIIKNIYVPDLNESPNIIKNKINNLNIYIEEVVVDENIKPSERVIKLTRYCIDNDIIRDKNIITLLLSIIMTLSIHTLGLDRNQKFFGTVPQKNDIALIFCTYVGLLNRMKKYEELKIFISEYINSDIHHREIFHNWLQDKLGHTDEDIFFDIIAKFNGIENKMNS